MRRYFPTLLVIFGLLAVGAVAIGLWQSGGAETSGPGDVLGLILAGTAGAIGAVALLGLIFAAMVNALAQAVSGEKPARAAAPAATMPVMAPAPKKAAAAPAFLYDSRSATIFLVSVTVLVAAFLSLRTLAAGSPPGYPLDREPDFSASLFELPGLNLPFTQALALGGTAVLAVFGTLVVGVIIAQLLALLGRQVLKVEAAAKAAEAPAAKPKAGPAAKPAAGQTPAVFLYDNRSVTIFFVVVVVFVTVFMGLRAWAAGTPLGATPFDRLLTIPLLTLPGEPVAGWPAFLPGPGGDLTALHVTIIMVVVMVGAVPALGVGLARLLTQYSATEKALEKAPPAWPAKEWAELEARLKNPAAAAAPRRLNGLDQFIILLGVVIVGLVLVWVLPGIGLTTSTDQAVAATQIAASWTPTPQPGPVVTLAELVAKLPAGEAAAGEAAVTARGCVACHIAVDPAVALVGPAWQAAQSPDGLGVSDHAAARWQEGAYTGKAQSPLEYLYESIVNPSAYVVAGFQPAMPANYREQLGDQELADIMAYLAELK